MRVQVESFRPPNQKELHPGSDYRLGADTGGAWLPDSRDRSRIRAPKANRRRRWVPLRRIHEHLVLKPRESLAHVQADELRMKAQGSIVWLGRAISPSRDTALIRRLVVYVRACASVEHPLLVATDGLITNVKAFRSKRYTGRVGAPRLIAWPEVVIGQVLKRYKRRTQGTQGN